VASFNEGDVIEGLAFSAAPLPSGSLYAVSSTNGNVYQITRCTDCGAGGFFAPQTIAHVTTTFDNSGNPIPNISGITIDPLLGDIYISEFNGPNILRIPPGGIPPRSEGSPFTFATGFRNTFGLAFDTNGNLYVNETNAGNLWKFTRNSFATSQQPITKGQTNTFTNPNSSMADQKHTVLIPPSANLCDPTSARCAAYLQAIFVPVVGTTLDARLLPGSHGDTAFFGGGPVPPGTTCIRIPSASPIPAIPTNCLVIIQKCYDANHKPFDICPVQEPPGSTDLIQLKSKFASDQLLDPITTAFLIDFDTPPNNQTLTDITIGTLVDPTGAGGTKGLCSQTFLAKRGPTVGPDFSLAISPSTLSLPGSSSATVTVTSINSFSSPVTLRVSDLPPGVLATLSKTSVTPSPYGSASTLNVSVGPSVTLSTFTLIITGNASPSQVFHFTSVDVNVCHYVTITLSPSTVAVGGTITVTGTLMSCKSTAQIISVQFTLTAPVQSGGCGPSRTVMFTTPPFFLPANTKKTFSFPFTVPRSTCPGAYTIAATTFVGGQAVDTSPPAMVTITAP
jgi:hypothetical protein